MIHTSSGLEMYLTNTSEIKKKYKIMNNKFDGNKIRKQKNKS